MDHKLKMISDLTALKATGTLRELKEKLYYSSSKLIVDEKHQVKLDLTYYDSITVLENASLLNVSKSGKNGLVDYEGKVVTPAKYDLPLEFFNGYSYNTVLGDEFLIKSDGTTQKLQDRYVYLNKGLLKKESNEKIYIYNFNYQELINFSDDYIVTSSYVNNDYQQNSDFVVLVLVVKNTDKDTYKIHYFK